MIHLSIDTSLVQKAETGYTDWLRVGRIIEDLAGRFIRATHSDGLHITTPVKLWEYDKQVGLFQLDANDVPAATSTNDRAMHDQFEPSKLTLSFEIPNLMRQIATYKQNLKDGSDPAYPGAVIEMAWLLGAVAGKVKAGEFADHTVEPIFWSIRDRRGDIMGTACMPRADYAKYFEAMGLQNSKEPGSEIEDAAVLTDNQIPKE
jgi:hypothetical protein